MGTSLREEMISLSLFGGRLALAELILFSVFLTDILMLGVLGEINKKSLAKNAKSAKKNVNLLLSEKTKRPEPDTNFRQPSFPL